jgi:hypothetical protein
MQPSERHRLDSPHEVADQVRNKSSGSEPQEPRGIEKGIADADKKARAGTTQEPLRNTPPAGAWNDTAAD